MSLDVIVRHAGWVLFVWVFVNQSGVPVPVVPSLVAAATLAGRGGPSGAVMLAAAVGGAMGADLLWYVLGRWRGAQALSRLSRLLHRPSTYADHVEHAFRAHEFGFQFSARFLPELNPIAAGLAGASAVALGRYIVMSGVTALVWAGAWLTVGYLLVGGLGSLIGSRGVRIIVLVALAGAPLAVIRYAWRHRARARLVKSAALVLVIVGTFAGCASVGPEYTRPAIPAMSEWRTPTEGVGSLADLEWWQLFQDPVLRELIGTALAENKDLRLAVARVAEARAQLAVTRAAQFPQLDAQGSYTNQRFSQKSFPLTALGSIPGGNGLDVQQDFYRTGLDLTFELDLWGRLRRGTEAARADLLASAENTRTVLTTLISDVAQNYFDLLELDREADIARRTLASRQASLELVRRRYEDGLTSELDVRRAEQELATAAAAVPDVERRIAQTEDRLSLLLGRNPGPIARSHSLDAQALPPEVPAGLPSMLLERRPDIRQAEEKLISANAHIGEAKAAFFPRISLTGMFGLESASLSELFTGPARVWQVGPTVTFPIFHAGQLRGNLHAAEARREQALIQYQQTIQQAFRDVNDALVFRAKAGEIRTQHETRVQAAGRALDIANRRYTNGLGTYLDVLDAQRQLFTAEIDLAGTTRDQLTAVVQVYKALGGGWEVQE
jgi:outer membrane protein, multidrug efflux system